MLNVKWVGVFSISYALVETLVIALILDWLLPSDQSLVPEPSNEVQEAKGQDAANTRHVAPGSDSMVPPISDPNPAGAASGVRPDYYSCQNPPRDGSQSSSCGAPSSAARGLARWGRPLSLLRPALLAS